MVSSIKDIIKKPIVQKQGHIDSSVDKQFLIGVDDTVFGKKSEISNTKIVWFWGFLGVVFSIIGTIPFYVTKKVDKTEKKKPIIFLALLILALIFSLILAIILWIIL